MVNFEQVLRVIIPAGTYLIKVNNINAKTKRGICSKLGVALVSLLLTLNIFHSLF